ncbi:MAG: hypothetical protein JKY12_01635 [Sneathiella sp.]|nr:hypothetical protein [Sneathiella sp.]
MARISGITGIIIIGILFTFRASFADYNYPINNPLAATIVGTPSTMKGILPSDIGVQERTLPILAEKKAPDGLWYNRDLKYSVALQDNKAPLVFVIAGTGASYSSQKMKVLQKNFYKAGYHVVNISSPSHSNFIVSASQGSVPGNLWIDAIDLHKVMVRIQQTLIGQADINGYSVSGYSLGGSHAAFVSAYDSQVKHFNFQKVLLINPAVNLYNSTAILDGMLDNSPYGSEGGVERLLSEVFETIVESFEREDFTEFSEDFLYLAYKEKRPTNAEMAALIGVSFRLSASNMIFTSDVMSKSGFIYPKDEEFGVTTSTTPYLGRLATVNFKTYISDLFFPHFKSLYPEITLQKLIFGSSLNAIENHIRGNPKFSLVTNADDIILAPGELSYLQSLFAGRAWIFPNGGHCGNLEHKDVLEAISSALRTTGKS